MSKKPDDDIDRLIEESLQMTRESVDAQIEEGKKTKKRASSRKPKTQKADDGPLDESEIAF